MRIAMVLGLIFSATSAWAGLRIEPIVGYSMGDYKTSTINTHVESNGRVDGFTYGGRLGWMFGGIFIGGEYQAARAQLKTDGTGDAINWSNQTLFGELGYEFLLGLRVYAGININPHKSQVATTPENTTYTGSAKKFGLGFQYHAPFAINADYVMYDLDESQAGATKTKISAAYEKFQYNAVVLSLSFPFTF